MSDDNNNPSIEGFRLADDQFEALLEGVSERVIAANTSRQTDPPATPAAAADASPFADSPILQELIQQAEKNVLERLAPTFTHITDAQRPLFDQAASERAARGIGAEYFEPIRGLFNDAIRAIPTDNMKRFIEDGGAELVAKSLAFDEIQKGNLSLGYAQTGNTPMPTPFPVQATRIEDLPPDTRATVAEAERMMGRQLSMDELRKYGVLG